jgi:hypothetical protein
LTSLAKEMQAIVTRERPVDSAILLETVGMLRATGIQAYDVDIDQISVDSHAPSAEATPPRLFVCCVSRELSSAAALRGSAGFRLAATAATDGSAALTVRHCADGGSTSANRSAEYVAEVAAYILDFPPPHPAIIHLDLHAAPGLRRVELACDAETDAASIFPVGKHHLTLTPFALGKAQSAAVRIWALNLFEKLYARDPTSLECACCAGTSFFTRLMCNKRSCENDEN